MNQTNEFDNALRATSNILLWCFAMSMVLLLAWFGMFVFAGQFIYDVHSQFFNVTENELYVVHYLLMTLWKIGAFAVFLFPAVAIRLVLRGRRV